jgi:DMSO reductase family type II enzyme chaperone
VSADRVSSAPEVKIGEENAIAASRSLIHAEFARALRHPADAEAAGRLADGSAERELIGLIDGLARRLPGYESSPLPKATRGGSGASDDVDVLYCCLFDPVSGAATISLNERDYATLGREVLWEDLFRCYAHFGLELGDGGLQESPDHLTIELEFMHFLTFLEASNPETARGVVLGESDFLARHLAAWMPRLCQTLAERSTDSVYHRIAHLLRDFVSADRVYLESRTHDLRRSTDDIHSPL